MTTKWVWTKPKSDCQWDDESVKLIALPGMLPLWRIYVVLIMGNEIKLYQIVYGQNATSCDHLTLKWSRYFYSRWCPRGFQGTPPKKTTFLPEFCNEICTIYVWAIKNHNSGFFYKKCCTVSKWQPNNRFLFCIISILAKIWKTTFPKEFFNEIWLKIGEHE